MPWSRGICASAGAVGGAVMGVSDGSRGCSVASVVIVEAACTAIMLLQQMLCCWFMIRRRTEPLSQSPTQLTSTSSSTDQ